MKLIISTDDNTGGGTAFVAKSLTLGLNTSFDVSVAFNCNETSLEFFKLINGLGVVTHNSAATSNSMSRSTYSFFDAKKCIEKASPDMLLFCDSRNVVSQLALKLVAISKKIPYVIVINSLPAETISLAGPFIELAQYTLQNAAAIIFVSNANKDRFQGLFPQVTTPLFAFPNACSADFVPSEDDSRKIALRRQFGFAPNDLIFLVVGRVERAKGQHLCFRALELLKQQGNLDGVKFVFAGRGSERYMKIMHQELLNFALGDSVIFLGPRLDVADLLTASDVFVLPSYMEGMPISILEAMAIGLPVIASDIDGIPELIDDSNGFLIPAPSINEEACITTLAEKVNLIKQNRPILKQLGQVSRAKSNLQFHADIMFARYRDLISSLAGECDKRNVANNYSLPAMPNSITILNDKIINFTKPIEAWTYLGSGWTESEADGVWSIGPCSKVHFDISENFQIDSLFISASPFIHERALKQIVNISVNNVKVRRWIMRSPSVNELSLPLGPFKFTKSVDLRFDHLTPVSPLQYSSDEDAPLISIKIHAVLIKLRPLTAEF